ncbi:glycosyltransferase family 4 protein [Macrococcus lamae]|uniref:glycosyltransferase family 4 protein n=1 Tax=Macrococcus lamae TaxID=198484 RepID=UPI00140C66E5|nr:glycosyltransferase family 4 protein [Macrococcus lamae]
MDLENLNDTGIYHDFVNELHFKGHTVTVVSASEKRKGGKTKLIKSNGIDVLKVRINDITKTSFIKKGVNTLLIEKFYSKAIKKYLSDRAYDLIIYTTPPITFNNLISNLKKKYNAKTYLLLKDIFPQNAIDLELFKKNSPIYQLFRRKEKKLYKISDYIGGMSKANIDYIKNHNKISAKTQIIRNAMYEQDFVIAEEERKQLIEKIGIDPSKKIFLYGGNLGIPQGVDYIKAVMSRFHEIENSQLLIIGNGTHYNDIKSHAEKLNNKDIKVLSILPKNEYDKVIALSDIGLIFLDHRFTIPNYPSRLTSLLNAGKPILAATDKNSDIKDDIILNGSGLWNESNNIDEFIQNANMMLKSEDFEKFKENAYQLYNKEFRIEKNIDKLLEMVAN